MEWNGGKVSLSVCMFGNSSGRTNKTGAIKMVSVCVVLFAIETIYEVSLETERRTRLHGGTRQSKQTDSFFIN